MVEIRVELDDLEAGAALRQLNVAAGDLSPLMDVLGAYLEQAARDRIEQTNRGPDGVPWPRSLRAEVSGGPTLFDSGRLAASLTHEAGRAQVRVGSNVIYAGIHQTGGEIRPVAAAALRFQLPTGEFVTAGSVNIPARPYLGVSSEDEEEMLALTLDWLGAPLKDAQ